MPVEPGAAKRDLFEALRETVRAHLIADVPVGVFLSAGLDSTVIAGLAAEIGADLRTVTLGFQEYRGTHLDEVPLAELAAKHFNAQHQTVWIDKEEFRSEYGRLLNAMDQPSIDGVNCYFVSMAAKKAGLKVALSGIGGDELFGGYPSFRQVPRSVRLFRWSNNISWLGKGFRLVTAPFLSRLTNPKYASMLEYGGSFEGAYLLRRSLMLPWELPKMIGAEMAFEGLAELQTEKKLTSTVSGAVTDCAKISSMESLWYMRNQLLRDADWTSMAHSLEIRVPFVDLNLLNTVVPLAESLGLPGKQTMARSLGIPLPEPILNRPKTGFNIPVRQWLLEDGEGHERGLRSWAQNLYEHFCN